MLLTPIFIAYPRGGHISWQLWHEIIPKKGTKTLVIRMCFGKHDADHKITKMNLAG